MSVQVQIRVFAVMAVCGVILGLAYDLLKLLNWLVNGGKIMRAALDLTFGILAAACVVAAGLRLRTEAFRLYVFAAVAAGFALYMTTLGTIVRVLLQKIRICVKNRTILDKKF